MSIKLRSTAPMLSVAGISITLIALFLLGGSARPDVQSLLILNPALILLCGAACFKLRQDDLQGQHFLLGALLLTFLLTAIYLMPLPKQLVNLAAEPSPLSAIRGLAEAPNVSTVFAVASDAAFQSLFFLFAPLAVYLFAIRLDKRGLDITLHLILVLGTLSGVVGVMQLVSGANGPLYLYRITNNGVAVGLFANRNHAAVFLGCMFPILAVFATKATGHKNARWNVRELIAVAIAILLVPLILVTGSRSGMIAAIIGLVGGALLYSSRAPALAGGPAKKARKLIFLVTMFLALVFATIYFSRAEAINRIFADSNIANGRSEYWSASLGMFWQYFPMGFGPGGFAPAFQVNEPLNLLDAAYLNRLHNDLLETSLTYGVPGLIAMLVGAAYYFRRAYLLWMRMDGKRSDTAAGRMASIIIAILIVASFSDYPLRTPALAGFAALALVWFAGFRNSPPQIRITEGTRNDGADI